jgi:hypothetical protein
MGRKGWEETQTERAHIKKIKGMMVTMMPSSLLVPVSFNSFRYQNKIRKMMPYNAKQCLWYMSQNIRFPKSNQFPLLRETLPLSANLMHSILLRPSHHAAVTVHAEPVVALVADRGHAQGTAVLASDPQVLIHTDSVAIAVS